MGWQDLFGKPNINHHIHENLELGFTQHGPTLILSGTLSAEEKVIYINSIEISVSKKKVGEKPHSFKWFAFRSHNFGAGSFSGHDMKMATRFILSPNQPQHYNILFSDQDQYALIRPAFAMVKTSWDEHMKNYGQGERILFDEIFSKFFLKKEIQATKTQFEELFYWRTGEFSVDIVVTTTNPAQTFEIKKSIHITEQDLESIRKNIYILIKDLCGLPKIFYQFATIKLA